MIGNGRRFMYKLLTPIMPSPRNKTSFKDNWRYCISAMYIQRDRRY